MSKPLIYHLQAWLRNCSEEDILEELSLSNQVLSRRDPLYPQLVLFKYDIGCDFSDPVVQASRGVILDEEANWQVVSYSYDKFFNYGESQAATIDWDSARVLEKLDGSLMVLYFWAGNWRVQSSGSPDAGGQVGANNQTFADLFWETFKQLEYKLPEQTNLCFSFELCTELNRIVVAHPKPKLILHGVRDRLTNVELDPRRFVHMYEIVDSFELNNLDSCLDYAAGCSPTQMEGFVVVDKNFNRIKIKSPQYVALHHLKDKVTTKGLIDVVRSGEIPEVALYLPDLHKDLEKAKLKLATLKVWLDVEYLESVCQLQIGGHDDIRATMKAYAAIVKDLWCAAWLFARFKNKVTDSQAYLDSLSSQDIVSLFEKLPIKE